MAASEDVLTLKDVGELTVASILSRYDLRLVQACDHATIPGSYWGAPEAGLVDDRVHVRSDTPVHSILHEACHYLCMTPARRNALHTDAGGDYHEENCVCYLQVVLADFVAGMGRMRMFADMDAWGYSFRLGSARAWFEQDTADVCAQLRAWGLIDARLRPTWRKRGAVPAPGYHACRA